MNETTRDIAQTLVDLYSAHAASEDDAEDHAAFDTAMQRLGEVDGVIATTDDEGALILDFTPILTASNIILMWALDKLVDETGAPEEALLFDLREFLGRVGT